MAYLPLQNPPPGLADVSSYLGATPATSGFQEEFRPSGGPEASALWPRWTPASDPGSLLGSFFSAASEGLEGFRALSDAVLRARVRGPRLSEPRLFWRVPSSFPPGSVVVLTPSASALIRPAGSAHELLYSADPVWLWDRDDACVYFANLSRAAAFAAGPEADLTPDLSPEHDVYYAGPGDLWTLAEAARSLTLTTGPSGAFVLYGSKHLLTQLSSGLARLDGGPSLRLEPVDFLNAFDQIGLEGDLERFPGEDNAGYWDRLRSIYPLAGSPTHVGVRRGVARRIGAMEVRDWDGVSALSWPASADVSDAWSTLKEKAYSAFEVLTRQGGRLVSRKTGWQDGSLVLEDGVPSEEVSESLGIVSSASSGVVTASYAYLNWTKAVSGGGVVRSAHPTRNADPGSYMFGWCRGLRSFTLSDPKFLRDRMLTPSGAPTAEFSAIAVAVRRDVPVTLNSARWGSAHWFSDLETRPEVSYLPLPLE